MLALASLFGFDWKSPVVEAPSAPEAGRRKGKTIINVKLKRGVLTMYGYHADNSARSRHAALMRAVEDEGYVAIIRRLNLIATYSKNRTPHYSHIFKQDQRWLSAKYKKAKQLHDGMRSRPWRNGSSKLTAGIGASGGGRLAAGPADPDDDYEDEEFDDEDSMRGREGSGEYLSDFDDEDEDETPQEMMDGDEEEKVPAEMPEEDEDTTTEEDDY